MDEATASAHSTAVDPVAHVIALAEPKDRQRLLVISREITIASELDWERHQCWDVTEWITDATVRESEAQEWQ